MQAPAEIAASQALFDLGIFQSSGKGSSGRSSPSSSSSSNEIGDNDARPCAALGSPFEEHAKLDWFADGDKHGLADNVRMGSRITVDALTCHANLVQDVMVATSRVMKRLSRQSLNSDMVGEESSSSSGNHSCETSWLDDPSDDEEDYSNSSQCSPVEAQSSDLEITRCDLGLENVHEPSIEYAAALTPRKATLIDVPSGRSSISSGNEHRPPSPPFHTRQQRRRPRACAPVTPPSSPRSSLATTIDVDYDEQHKQLHTTMAAETQGLTILTPPPTPEKVTPRPSISCSSLRRRRRRLNDVLSKIEHAVTPPSSSSSASSPHIDSSLLDLLREAVVRPRSQSQSSRAFLPCSLRSPLPYTRDPTTTTTLLMLTRQAHLCRDQSDVVGIVPAPIRSLVQALNLLEDYCVTDTSTASSTRPRPGEDDGEEEEEEEEEEDATSHARRIESLRRNLKHGVVRAIVESGDAGKDVLVRALGVVVRLGEGH
ncbi:MAG: hypothetical protein M1816_000907 [Peltula sp. TS41687]|nr:MAG: hypothetical protein M1816_000907 [Peltula sp. TS41687]